MAPDEPIRLRTYLMVRTAQREGSASIVDWMIIAEAVASTAIEHPEWDMDEQRTFDEWEAWASS